MEETTPLHEAVRSGNVRFVQEALPKPDVIVDPSEDNKIRDEILNAKEKTNQGHTPLHVATLMRHKQIMTLLIYSGAKVDKRNNWHKTALDLAFETRKYDPEIVKILVEAGADLKDKNDLCHSALHFAVLEKDLWLLKYLLYHGAEVDIKGDNGLSPLHLAAVVNKSDSHVEVIRTLLNNRANPNVQDRFRSTPFHALVETTNIEIIQELLNNFEANFDVKNDRGETPLFNAVSRNRVDVVQLLISRGSDVNLVNAVNKITPLHEAAFQNSGDSHLEMISVLLKNEADVNAQDVNGRTPMHYLVRELESAEAVRVLLSFKARIDVSNNYGDTPLFEAVYGKNIEVVQLLLDHGADVNGVNAKTGKTLLEMACENLEEDESATLMVKFLLNNGATPLSANS